MNLVGGDGRIYFTPRSIHPLRVCGTTLSFPQYAIIPNRCISIIRINNLKINIQYIGTRPLGNISDGRLRNHIPLDKPSYDKHFQKYKLFFATLNYGNSVYAIEPLFKKVYRRLLAVGGIHYR